MMNKINKWLPIVTFVMVLALVLVGGNKSTGLLSGTTNFDDLELSGTLTSAYTKIGSSGTTIAKINTGTCYIKAYATTIAATSTATVDCQATADVSASGISALTGITAGDIVSANLATSTAGTTVGGLVLAGASASSTSGYITLRITNLTGTTYTWPVTGTASGTATYIVTDI